MPAPSWLAWVDAGANVLALLVAVAAFARTIRHVEWHKRWRTRRTDGPDIVHPEIGLARRPIEAPRRPPGDNGHA